MVCLNTCSNDRRLNARDHIWGLIVDRSPTTHTPCIHGPRQSRGNCTDRRFAFYCLHIVWAPHRDSLNLMSKGQIQVNHPHPCIHGLQQSTGNCDLVVRLLSPIVLEPTSQDSLNLNEQRTNSGSPPTPHHSTVCNSQETVSRRFAFCYLHIVSGADLIGLFNLEAKDKWVSREECSAPLSNDQ
ncbi:hypothetical protein AVEN_244700-1 [Araneus ventricosus]|uniref:Uncharacterized protein n=1 Tax=Araneus ventricosus TaxID=182803 RepID=A0A4Y2TZ18_ARAVE|nr:hypothetical protein AVEN_244700-1 [Araneus ventricosus]